MSLYPGGTLYPSSTLYPGGEETEITEFVPLPVNVGDPLTDHREEVWKIAVFTRDEQYLGELDGVMGGEFEFSIHNTIRSGGSLTYAGDEVVDWNQVRLQPWYTAQNESKAYSWPLGMFIPAAPVTEYDDGGYQVKLELYDKLLVLVQDQIEITWTFDKGTVVTDAIKYALASTGETKMLVTDSTLTLATPMVWEAGTTMLQIVNDLLDSINYFSLWVDGYGVYRADPYVEPQSRGLGWAFIDDEHSIMSPEFSHDADAFNVPNKVVLIGKSEGDDEAPTVTVRNELESSPWSWQNRGRWITHVEKDVEAATPLILADIANRRMLELSQVTSSFEIKHAHVPLELNTRIELVHSTAKFSLTAVLQSMTINMETGALVKSTIRQVV